MIKTHPLPAYVQRFFTQRLLHQLGASPNTIAGYRDTFRLLLGFAERDLKIAPTDMQVSDIDAELVVRFLAFVENERGNGARSRNTRLAAIRSFFKYVSVNEPQLLRHCQRVLAIPSKRHAKRTVGFLTREEMEALIGAPDPSTWFGRRDRTILLVMLQTGLRVSELVQLRNSDIELGPSAFVRCMGKGRKERMTPLRTDCARALRKWMAERGGDGQSCLFMSNRGDPLSRDAIERLVRKHADAAAAKCRTIAGKRVTPHVLRHSAAMQLLQNGVDLTVIALWLGHESVETTQMYIHADLQLKEKAMARTRPVKGASKPGRFQPDDKLLAFLEAL